MIASILVFLALQTGPAATAPVAPAAGPTTAELIERGEKALADLEYDLAAEELMRAATAPDATPEQRLRAHLLAGTANRIAGHDVDAQINFRYVLTNAPDTRLPEGTPPKVLAFFEAVRQQVQSENRSASAVSPPQSTPTPAPAPEAAPATNAAGAFPLGLAVTGAGAAIAALGAAGLIGAEVYLMDPSADGGTRGSVQTLGVVSAGVLGVGLVAAIAGGALWGAGVLP